MRRSQRIIKNFYKWKWLIIIVLGFKKKIKLR